MQQLQLDRISQIASQHIGVARPGIDGGQCGSVVLELTSDGGCARGLAADIEDRRHVKVNVERSLGEIQRGIFLAE